MVSSALRKGNESHLASLARGMSTKRTSRLLETQRGGRRWISADRARLFTEAFAKHSGDPLPTRRAKAYRYVLENIPIAIHPGELIVGGLTEKPNGAILFPEVSTSGMKPSGRFHAFLKTVVAAVAGAVFGLAGIIIPRMKGLRSMLDLIIELKLDTFESRPTHSFSIDAEARKELFKLIKFWRKKSAIHRFKELMPPKVKRRTSEGQLAYAAVHQFTGGVKQFYADFGAITHKGIESLLEEAKARVKKRGVAEQVGFFEASALTLEGLLSFAERYAKLAESMVANAVDQEERENLRRIAEICHTVPRKPATTFREALQSIWFSYLALVFDDGGMEIPLGRLDQVLWKYYRDDLSAGRLTKDEAVELVEVFFIKVSEMEFLLDNGANRVEDGNSARMSLTIGGIGRDGQDTVNELSFIFLEVSARAGTIQPNVAVRIHPLTPPAFYDRVIEVISSGVNSIQLFNDEVIVEGLRRKKIALEDARDYVVSGCVQPLPSGGYGSTCASHIYLPRTLLLFLDENKLSFESFQDFLSEYKGFLKEIVSGDVTAISAADKAHLLLPNPLVSAFVPGSFEKGLDVKSGGAQYNLSGVSLSGTGTLVDSLQSIETLVFKERKYSLDQIVKMMKRNYHGHEAERIWIQNRIAKYGNDVAEVDMRAGDFTQFIADEFGRYTTFRGGEFFLGMHTEANHVLFGLFTGATPDGRLEGEPFSVGAGTAGGRDRNGHTAFLNSVLNIDFRTVNGGSSVNIRVNPKLLESEGEMKRFASMIRSYFEKGGPHFQANVVSADLLRDAQQNPEKYGDLIVRVSGFSARFIELTRQTQNEIIARSEES